LVLVTTYEALRNYRLESGSQINSLLCICWILAGFSVWFRVESTDLIAFLVCELTFENAEEIAEKIKNQIQAK